mgnify:CR=1 FL=1
MKVRLILQTIILIPIEHIFQFHEGSINTRDGIRQEQRNPDFNSMKVRLILPKAVEQPHSWRFQFHEGSINTQIMIHHT